MNVSDLSSTGDSRKLNQCHAILVTLSDLCCMAFLSKRGEARIPQIVYLMLSTTSSSSEESFTKVTTAIPPPMAPALQAEVAMSSWPSCNLLLRFREMSDSFYRILAAHYIMKYKKGYTSTSQGHETFHVIRLLLSFLFFFGLINSIFLVSLLK